MQIKKAPPASSREDAGGAGNISNAFACDVSIFLAKFHVVLQRKKLPQLPLGRMPGELTTLCMLLPVRTTGAVLASPSHQLPQHSYTNYNCIGTISQGGKPPRISCKFDSGRTTLNVFSKAQTWGRCCHNSLPPDEEAGWLGASMMTTILKLTEFHSTNMGS